MQLLSNGRQLVERGNAILKSSMSDFKITEQDVQSTLKYLKIFHPESANRGFAEEMLHYLKATYHRIALTDPDILDELYENFQRKRNS